MYFLYSYLFSLSLNLNKFHSIKNNLFKIKNEIDIQMIKFLKGAVCFELMVPPNYTPILLFPCGHTFCRQCVYHNHKLDKCPYCRKRIVQSAVNISLQNLICVFTNKKHLLEQEIPEEKEQNESESDYQQNINFCNMRKEILLEEKNQLQEQNTNISNDLKSLQVISKKLNEENTSIQDKIDKLRKEQILIEKYIDQQSIDISQKNKEYEANKQKLDILNETISQIDLELQKNNLFLQKQ